MLLQIFSLQLKFDDRFVMGVQEPLGLAVALGNLCIDLRVLLIELFLECLVHAHLTLLHHLADFFYHRADSMQLGFSVLAERLDLLILNFMRVFNHFLELLFTVGSRSLQCPLDLVDVFDQAVS